MKYYLVVFGTILVLVGLFGWIFRDTFGSIPVYHLVVDIVFGLASIYYGFRRENPPGQGNGI